MDTAGKQYTPEEIYHELVLATSTADILNAVSRRSSVPLKTLALRKIAMNYKHDHADYALGDPRYHSLKNDVLLSLNKLQRQDMCDVLYWL
jgi:hypothetical protein